MKCKAISILLFFLISVSAITQESSLILSFTAVVESTYAQLESIKVINKTQGGDTTLIFPDTVLVLISGPTDITDQDYPSQGFELFQNYPNPVLERTMITMYVPDDGIVNLVVSDIQGREVFQYDHFLSKGYHSFNFNPGDRSVYLATAFWQGKLSSIKIINAGNSKAEASLKYAGLSDTRSNANLKSQKAGFQFTMGDELMYICYMNDDQTARFDKPFLSRVYTFQFATNIPCPDEPVINYGGQTYNTIQVFDQCWMKENLNVGTMLSADVYPSDNGVDEKYCYEDLESNCNKYGGLYMWDELMQYTTTPRSRGLCPPGWHIPDSEEWKILLGSVDSEFGIGHPSWDGFQCGSDVGLRLKSTELWADNGNGTDDFGFTILPAGFYMYFPPGSYGNEYWSGDFRTSSEGTGWSAWNWNFHKLYETTRHYDDEKEFGYSVRCLKDN